MAIVLLVEVRYFRFHERFIARVHVEVLGCSIKAFGCCSRSFAENNQKKALKIGGFTILGVSRIDAQIIIRKGRVERITLLSSLYELKLKIKIQNVDQEEYDCAENTAL